MARVSHSLLDPFVSPLVAPLYRALPIPMRFPPEGIVLIGHLIAIGGAVGFAFSTHFWWAGILAMAGVAGNHVADMVDGTHARRTGQCRNGGELLDHFTDPLSFAYWMVGLSVSCGRLDLGIALVICIYATSVLTIIKAKIIGEFTLARFGPSEFKALLCLYGVAMAIVRCLDAQGKSSGVMATWFAGGLVALGVGQLIVNLVLAVRTVNRSSAPPDTSEWKMTQTEELQGESSV